MPNLICTGISTDSHCYQYKIERETFTAYTGQMGQWKRFFSHGRHLFQEQDTLKLNQEQKRLFRLGRQLFSEKGTPKLNHGQKRLCSLGRKLFQEKATSKLNHCSLVLDSAIASVPLSWTGVPLLECSLHSTALFCLFALPLCFFKRYVEQS